MAVKELYVVKRPYVFAGIEGDREKAVFIILGVPLDTTASYRSGQRFAPFFIREASINIESNAYFFEGFIDEVQIYDEGDLVVVHGDVLESLERLVAVTEELVNEGKRIVAIGGEHIMSFAIAKGLARAGYKPCLLVFDAHLDLRSDYLGVRFSHACIVRRVLEALGDIKIAYIGTRAYSREEVDFVRTKPSVQVVYARTIEALGLANVSAIVKRHLSGCEHIYLTIDMDVYDPSFAPGVGNPEPVGLTPREVLPLIAKLTDERVIAIDVVEVAPPFDVGGVTSVLAAKTLQEAVLAVNSSLVRSREL
ncbi:MAG: agmatinase [Acidilobaceae archaeon]